MSINSLSVPHDTATHYHEIWDLRVISWYPGHTVPVGVVVGYTRKNADHPYCYVPVQKAVHYAPCVYQIAGVIIKEIPSSDGGSGIVRLSGPVQINYVDYLGINKGDWLQMALGSRGAVEASRTNIATTNRKRFAWALEDGAAGAGQIRAMMVPWRL